MKLLFIDHECHRKTRSAEFFLDVLRKAFEVKEHYYSRPYRTGSAVAAKGCDVAVVWEFPISRRNFFFAGKKNVFVPMYDNEWASYWQWKRIAWSGMGVVSFCDKVTKHARRCGVKNILDVRYFPDPAGLPQAKGDPRRVFLWERGEMDRSIAERLFPSFEGYFLDVKGADESLDRDAYLERMSRCGIVIAPRRKEGIGMAFLEAMAMGKCVVANDDATMNEYIEDGENGILFNFDDPRPISRTAVLRVLGNVGKSAAGLRTRWMAAANGVPAFVESLSPCRPSHADRLKIALSYPLYLAEGAVRVLADNIGKTIGARCTRELA
jgi:hypothetical protein